MDNLDKALALWVNGLIGTYPHFDAAVAYLSRLHLLKGGVLCAVFWMLWASPAPEAERRRCRLLALTFACFAALVVARALAVTLPFRLRPLHDPELDLVLARRMTRGALEGWSSLPSDHAALFFAFAGGLWFASRRWGAAALVYVAVLICLPRFYLGLHYPSDLALGAAVGLTGAWLCNREPVMRITSVPVLALGQRHVGLLHAALFLVTYQIAAMFGDTISLAKEVGWFLMHR